MKSILIIGMGRMGRHLAKKMYQLGNDVMIVDKNVEMIESLSDRFTDSNICDCTNESVITSLSFGATKRLSPLNLPAAPVSAPASSSRSATRV